MQTPAYSDDEILAAGYALMHRGERPSRLGLFNALGRRGLPATAWNAWLRMQQVGLPDFSVVEDETETSPAVAKASHGHEQALSTLLEAVKADVTAPLNVRIQSLERSLHGATRDNRDLEALVDSLSADIEDLKRKLAEATAAQRPKLIL